MTAASAIHVLPIPTPFAVGRVNCYLIEDEPLTLVDSGPNSGKALDALERALAEHGRHVEDLELIVVTHQHIDHLGLVDILARRSGAEVAALENLAPYLEDYSGQAEADDTFAGSVMRRNGIAEDVVSALRAVSAAFRGWGGGAHVTRALAHGSVLTLRDRRLRVLHRPGHSPSDTVFHDEEREELIGGDHLIGHISSNPLVTRPLPGTERAGEERPRALLDYLDSLRRTRELELRRVLPGHGDEVTDHRPLIDERFAMHGRRAEKIHGLLRARPLTAHEVAQDLWGKVAVTQAYLTLSEVLGHADLLAAEGRAVAEDDGDVIRWRALP